MKYNKLSFLAIFVLSSVLFFVFPFMSDDWKFSEASSLGDCIDQTMRFYNHWNGRIIPNFAGFFLCSLVPNWIYALFTGAIYTLYVWLVVKLSGRKVGIFVAVILTLLLPAPMECYFWRIGNVNYLYAAVFMLLSIWLFDGERAINRKNIGACALIGVLTGITHEAVSLPLLGGFILYMLINRNASKLQIALLIGLGIGTVVNVLCPGTFVRSGTLQSAPAFNIVKCLFSEVTCAWFSIACFVALIVAYRKKMLSNVVHNNKLYFILWIVNVCFVFALAFKSVSVGGRVLYLQEVCALLLFVKIVSTFGISLNGKIISRLAMIAAVVAFCYCLVSFHGKSIATNAELENLKATNDSIVRANVLPLSIDSKDPSNNAFCRIYNKNVLYALKSPIYEDLFINGSLDESKKVDMDGVEWYKYGQTFVKEIKGDNDYTTCEYESVPYIGFAPDFLNQKLAKIRKKATLPIYILPSKDGLKQFVVVDVAGQMLVKKVVSLNLK